MQIKGKYNWLKHFDFMIIDLISLILAFVIAYYVKFRSLNFVQSETWMRYILIVSMLSILITFFVNPYSGIFRRSYYQEIIKALKLAVYNLLLVSVILFFFKIGEDYSRELTGWMYIIYFTLSLILKYIWKKLLVSGKVILNTTKRIPLFIIGNRESIDRTIRNVTAGDFQLYDIKGVHVLDGDVKVIELEIEGKQKTISVVEEYVPFILSNHIREVLVATTPSAINHEVYEKLNANGIGLNIVVEYAVGFQPEDQYIQNFGVYKALSIGAFSFTPGQMIFLKVKRLVDIFAGIIGVILLIPITLIIKLVNIASGDSGPMFYRQKRVGQNGKLIRIWKFRSMVMNADEILEELLKDPEYKRQWDENQKFDDDPRITKAGRVLRKTSIDELPQLINVLKGDMSLVGPRPLVEGELEEHGGLKLYQKVKPGITGWWGCNGRSNIDYRERLELEYYYVKNYSLYLDALCIFRTFLAVIKRDGAQ